MGQLVQKLWRIKDDSPENLNSASKELKFLTSLQKIVDHGASCSDPWLKQASYGCSKDKGIKTKLLRKMALNICNIYSFSA